MTTFSREHILMDLAALEEGVMNARISTALHPEEVKEALESIKTLRDGLAASSWTNDQIHYEILVLFRQLEEANEVQASINWQLDARWPTSRKPLPV